MKLTISHPKFSAHPELLAFVEKKIEKLGTFYSDILEADATLILDKRDNKENKVFELKVHIPNHSLFAKEQCASFEEATDKAVEALRKQLLRYKGKEAPSHEKVV